MTVFLCTAQTTASTPIDPIQLSADWARNSQMTSFFKREDIVGSRFLSKGWSRGMAVMSNRRVIPEASRPLLFNFDKAKNVLFTVDQLNKMISYPIDSVISFEMADEQDSYSFIKVPQISVNFFLIPIIRSEKGYSLYKRLLTRLIQADFSSEGYYTKGKRYDEYVDYYEYYITYPGNTTFKKLFLKETAVRRVLREESVLLTEFFSLHDNDINEQSLLGIIQFINDKKYPE